TPEMQWPSSAPHQDVSAARSDSDPNGSDWPAPMWPPAPTPTSRPQRSKRSGGAGRGTSMTRASSAKKPQSKRGRPSTAQSPASSSPSIGKIVLATVGAVAIGLGIISLQVLTRPSQPSPNAPATADTANTPRSASNAGTVAPKGTAPDGTVSIPTARKPPSKNAAVEPEQASLLSVVSQPMGADVTLDGEFLGATPIVLRRSLPPTDYILRITKEGFVPWQRVVQPTDKGALNISIVLVREASR
ncbi:MAG: PEGA domain-containing protein, partial [Myxococcota bacterium]